MNYTLDCSGLACPQPVIETKKCIESGEYSEVKIIVDNIAAKENVSRFVKNFGHKVIEIKEIEKKYHINVKLENSNKIVENNFDEYVCEIPQHKGKTIFIGTPVIGKGSEILGQKLMNAFIYTLTELSEKPGKLIFMNAGVKLCINGAETLKSLKILEDENIEILVCGTCLDFYEITSELAVGKISNMYDIAESMLNKEQVVSIT